VVVDTCDEPQGKNSNSRTVVGVTSNRPHHSDRDEQRFATETLQLLKWCRTKTAAPNQIRKARAQDKHCATNNVTKTSKLRVVVIKPSKYDPTGLVERFWKGLMTNSTIYYIASLTPREIAGVPIEVHTVDEYVEPNLEYLELLRKPGGTEVQNLVALVGVQSHQFQRALDLAAYAVQHGSHAIIGGPHAMTCDTTMLHEKGISFSLSEAELVWPTILENAVHGQLQPVYGHNQRWQQELEAPIVNPPNERALRRYIDKSCGCYPVRGCPYSCTFCSVIKIAGQVVRSQPIAVTIESLKRAKAAGVRNIVFTADNFNKYDRAPELLQAMVDERINLPFFVQCDTQVLKQPELVTQLGRAGCAHMFLGFESFSRKILLSVHKAHNHPENYADIIRLCHENGIQVHFSNMIGFKEQTEDDIREHMRVLLDVSPDVAWFYILCAIPGTEDYDQFLEEGLISEPNLDRFDASCLVWEHPNMTKKRLQQVLVECYKRFYGFSETRLRTRKLKREGHGSWARTMGSYRDSFFVRLALGQGMHPMAGGIYRRRLDHVRDYIGLRHKYFDFDLAPLPKSLRLSAQDEAFNRGKKLVRPVLADV
jgi:hypothetical protein